MILHPTYIYWQKKIGQLFYKKKEVKIIDYGCGNGVLIEIIPKHNIKSYVGLDTSNDAIKNALKKYLNYKNYNFFHFGKKEYKKIKIPKNQDIFMMIGVLQYLDNSQINYVIRQSSIILRKGGYFLASTVVDDKFYMYINLYKFVFPNRYINELNLYSNLEKNGYKIIESKKRGLIIGPLVSHAIVIPFDAIDHYILGYRGKIGFFGSIVRIIFLPLMYLELLLPYNRGYTLYVVAQKK